MKVFLPCCSCYIGNKQNRCSWPRISLQRAANLAERHFSARRALCLLFVLGLTSDSEEYFAEMVRTGLGVMALVLCCRLRPVLGQNYGEVKCRRCRFSCVVVIAVHIEGVSLRNVYYIN